MGNGKCTVLALGMTTGIINFGLSEVGTSLLVLSFRNTGSISPLASTSTTEWNLRDHHINTASGVIAYQFHRFRLPIFQNQFFGLHSELDELDLATSVDPPEEEKGARTHFSNMALLRRDELGLLSMSMRQSAAFCPKKMPPARSLKSLESLTFKAL
ncbi:hypothetical protein Tco_0307737 [Tanacetum coccineum]